MWQPVLPEALAARAREAIEEIGDALENPPPVPLPWADYDPSLRCSLFSEWAGIAVFFAYRYRVLGAKEDLDRSMSFLEKALEAAAIPGVKPVFAYGFSGVAWAQEHLAQLLPNDLDPETGNEELDVLLRNVLEVHDELTFNLRDGVSGYGIYALERLPAPSAQRLLEFVLERLVTLSQVENSGTTWLIPPAYLNHARVEDYPLGKYELTPTDGIMGPLLVVAGACAHGVGGAGARRLLEGGVEWIRAHRIMYGGELLVPIVGVPGPDGEFRPLAVSGTHSIQFACSFLAVAMAAGRSDWHEEALSLGRAAARTTTPGEVKHAALLDGAAGVAHSFLRLYHASGEAAFRNHAVDWYGRLLDMRRPGTGLGGYQFWVDPIDKEVIAEAPTGWLDMSGIVTGSAGVGLALLAAIGTTEPGWDRMLLYTGRLPST